VVVAALTYQPGKAIFWIATPKESLHFRVYMVGKRLTNGVQRATQARQTLPYNRKEQFVGGSPNFDDTGHAPLCSARGVPSDFRRSQVPQMQQTDGGPSPSSVVRRRGSVKTPVNKYGGGKLSGNLPRRPDTAWQVQIDGKCQEGQCDDHLYEVMPAMLEIIPHFLSQPDSITQIKDNRRN